MIPSGMKIKQVETLWEAFPNPGVSLDELLSTLRAIGNPIVRIDREKGCVVLRKTVENGEGRDGQPNL